MLLLVWFLGDFFAVFVEYPASEQHCGASYAFQFQLFLVCFVVVVYEFPFFAWDAESLLSHVSNLFKNLLYLGVI